MSLFVWVMMGIAHWHFAIWVPDRFWADRRRILAAIFGACVIGFAIAGFKIIGRHDLDVSAAFEAIPGAIIGLVASCSTAGTSKRPKQEEAPPRERPGAALARSVDRAAPALAAAAASLLIASPASACCERAHLFPKDKQRERSRWRSRLGDARRSAAPRRAGWRWTRSRAA